MRSRWSSWKTRTRPGATGNFSAAPAREMLWPKIDPEYQSEMLGIVDGLQAKGGKLDIWDIVAFNAFSELRGLLRAVARRADRHQPFDEARTVRALQRVRCEWQLDEGPPDRDGAQQLDELHRGLALEHRFRHRSRARLPHADGRFPGRDHERRRFRGEFGGADDHRDDHLEFSRMGSRTARRNSFARERRRSTRTRSTATRKS